MTTSALYVGVVAHARHRPVQHRLSYRVFMGLFDLDELAALPQVTRLFGYNRPALISFHDRDHGDGSDSPLRPQIERALAAAGIAFAPGPIRVLCMPRVLGLVFNPLSVFFCHDADGVLRATVHEVHNTYGERHFYCLSVGANRDGAFRQACEKAFRVSPFTPARLHYDFDVTPPADRTAVRIEAGDPMGPLLTASFAGRRLPFGGAEVLRAWLGNPAQTVKVVVGIHWEALLTWLKLRRVGAHRPDRAPQR